MKLYRKWLMLPESTKEVVVTCVTLVFLLGALYAYVVVL